MCISIRDVDCASENTDQLTGKKIGLNIVIFKYRAEKYIHLIDLIPLSCYVDLNHI